jgi:2-polyprenyl-3-methyl-5-hydroxy-6-metoxy-1,4-benzoquinol methylase
MKTQQHDFDKKAATWDENPTRVKLAEDVVQAIRQQVRLLPDMDVLDFGCGTGLLALSLLPAVKSVTGADTSQGMLDVLEAKAKRQGLSNVYTRHLHPGERISGAYDLIISSMTLHHVEDTEALLAQMFQTLKPSGSLCLADLDLEPGTFHDDNTGIFHFGFDRDALRSLFVKAGFSNVRAVTATEVIKPNPSGGLRTFPVFLMVGEKMVY